jgi:predicted ATPase
MRAQAASSSSPLQLDLANECVWRGAQAIPLRPKTFAVLRRLVQHQGQLVTKAALLDAVWPETVVGDGSLMVCIRELRELLGDDARTPRFIQTVHRRGYRFIGAIDVYVTAAGAATRASVPAFGRETELLRLHGSLDRALGGAHQVVFVTGEAGLGKTTLVDAFVAEAQHRAPLVVTRGQCIDHYGQGEPYLPVLEALGRLCAAPGGARVVQLLERLAPTWLVHLPWVLDSGALEALRRRTAQASREGMLREMAEAVVAMTAVHPLIVVLEDLHWSDHSTLDLIASLARRPESARLLIVATYRTPDALRGGHPVENLKRELHVHGDCDELALAFLSEAAIAEYLARRLPGLPLVRELARIVHLRTEGNPLFMVNVLESWRARDLVVEHAGRWALRAQPHELESGVPETLRRLIEHQLDRLSPEQQRVLEAGSIAGSELSTAAVAAGLGQEVVQIEECCAELARKGQFLRASGDRAWPDGTVATSYSFLHALYHDVLYERVTAARRAYLHRRIGAREEEGYGAQAEKRAAVLAMHFERGADPERAILHLRRAAAQALRRFAYSEAVGHLSKALTLLAALPQAPGRLQQEVDLRMALGPALMATKGYAAPEVEQTYARAWELCREIGETAQLFPVLVGLRRFHLLRANLRTARQLGEECLVLANRAGDDALAMEAHWALGVTLCFQGEFAESRQHSERGVALYVARDREHHTLIYGGNAGVGSLCYAGLALWFLGYPDEALAKVNAARRLAEKLSDPFSLAYALVGAAWLHQFRREAEATQACADATIVLSRAQGFPLREAQGTILSGWAQAARGRRESGILQMQHGLATFEATGAELNRTYYLALLAETCGEDGRVDEAIPLISEALGVVHRGGECWWEAELCRLGGELLWKLGDAANLDRVEEHFARSLAVSRRQQARSLELRAALSLGRLWRDRGRHADARRLLADTYNSFTEGFGTADLVETRMLLAELSIPVS